MQPTKCHRIAGLAITDSVQLEYLKHEYTYMKNYLEKKESPSNTYTEKIKQIEKAMSEGLHHQPLVKREEIHQPRVHYPDVMLELEEGIYHFVGKDRRIFRAEGFYDKIDEVPQNLPSFKLASIDIIEINEITDKFEKLYRDKKIYITAKVASDTNRFRYTFSLSLKEDQYICVDKVYDGGNGLINDYISHTWSYQQMFLQQFFERRIDLALLGHGELLKYKDLPVITLPKRIKE